MTGPGDMRPADPLPADVLLSGVLPAAARSLGVQTAAPGGVLLPAARNVVVVLVDGLGDHLLARRGGHAPFLSRLRREPDSLVLQCGFPSTTASSLGSFGTGLGVGTHGLVGTDVLDPARGVLFNELSWDPLVDPRDWQPMPTVFEQVTAAGLDAVHIGPAFMAGSGLTTAALRGARFLPADELSRRVDAAVEVSRSGTPSLVYLYWGDLDKTGHVHGCDSWQWGDELTAVDSQLARLARTLPADTLLLVTADHGMVDVPFESRIDVAHEPQLQAGVRVVGGEPRAVQVYCEDGQAEAVAARWRARLEDAATVLTRDEALAGGWFGPVRSGVEARIGDVVVSVTARTAVVDSRTMRATLLRLLGQHGAATEVERAVPLLITRT